MRSWGVVALGLVGHELGVGSGSLSRVHVGVLQMNVGFNFRFERTVVPVGWVRKGVHDSPQSGHI